jgi:hypothetical protein
MKPGPAAIAALILSSTKLDAAPLEVTEIITRLIVQQKWYDDSTAREKAESWQDAVLLTLQRELNSLQELGRPARITFNSSSEYIVQGACFVEPSDSTDVAAQKRRRTELPNYAALLQQLKPIEFEQLCGKLIGLLGVQNPTVTRTSADEGIDFFGVLSMKSMFYPQDAYPTLQTQLSIWLVGQAKRYQQIQAGTAEVRALVGSVALGRTGTFGSLQSPLADLKIRPADPVFVILATTGSFSSNAWRLLQRSGVIGFDGEMMAAFLADRGIGIKAGVGLDESTFLGWLTS